MMKTQRNTLFSLQAAILAHHQHPAQQFILRLDAPDIAQTAKPGSFVHLQCHPELPMRRPLSIMRTDPRQGWIEILYKVVGHGTRLLATRRPGETLPTLGPVGNGFRLDPARPRRLLIGGGVGVPPMIFLAQQISTQHKQDAGSTLAVFGSEVPFPFTPRPSQLEVPGITPSANAAMPLLEDWQIASRLCSLQNYAGHYHGYVTDLVQQYLAGLDRQQHQQVALFACGPEPMLQATAALAGEHNLPCQVSLEEYMACALGGCAGCVVKVRTGTEYAMKRVCVDGPVFDAEEVYGASG